MKYYGIDELKHFKIIKEQSSSAKVRRIKAIIDYK